MTKYFPTNRNHPCPVCDKTNGNCRLLENDLVLCMTSLDGYGMENHPEYRYIKLSKNGLWGIYVPRRDNDFDRERWLRERQDRFEIREKEQAQQHQMALPVEVRDRDIKATLGQLTLNEGDRAGLHRRGFTDEDIQELGYQSVKQWQPLTGDLHYAVNRKGNLNNPTDGVLVPIPYFGKYQALRLYNSQGRPKYRSFTGSHLQNGEFPIAVYGHKWAKGMTWVTEGLEFKPALTSRRFKVPVIGHNGSNFTSSKNQVKEALTRLNTHTVVIALDGGVTENRGLVNQYEKAIAFYRSLGYTVLIAWWGQFTKADGDIDEIDPNRVRFIPPQQFLSYCQGSYLERFKDWVKKQIRPKPQGFKPVEGTPYQDDLIQTQINEGKAILDARPTGSGKSHAVPSYENPFGGKTWYLATDHRNPSIPAIADNFSDLFPRNQWGFYRDAEGKLRPAKADTPKEHIVETRGKCIKAPLFTQLSDLGYDPNQGGSQNPICQSCPMKQVCQFAEGWFLHDRRETMEHDHIRAHVESLPRDYDSSKDLVIIEEPGQSLKTTKTIESNWEKLLIQLDAVRNQLSGDDYATLDAVMQALKPLFSDRSKYGLEHPKILQTIGTVTLPESIVQAITVAVPKLADIFTVEEADSRLTRSQINFAQSLIGSQALANVPPNALVYVVKALRGTPGITLRIVKGQLIITLDRRSDYSPFFEKAGSVVGLDATLAGEEFQLLLGVNRPIEVVTAVSPKVTEHDNLEVLVIKTKGLGSRDVSDKALGRIYKLLQTLGQQYNDFPVIAPKHLRERLDLDGHWFVHNRGVNDFEGTPTMAYIGLPRPNVGMVQDEYLALHGTLDEFKAYYQTLINKEIVQSAGRPRANRRPHQQFVIIYIVPEEEDLSWLSDYGVKVTTKTAFEVNPLAGSETQCTRFHILETIQSLLSQGVKVTQAAIAQMLGMTQQGISKTLAESGLTLSQIVEKLTELLPTSYTTGPNKDLGRPSCMTEQLYSHFREFFELDPLLLVEEAVRTIKDQGLTYFWEEFLPSLPQALQGEYLAGLLSLFWDDLPDGGVT